MQKSKILMAVALVAAMVFSGFQCSSTELTSARLYIQQENFQKAIDALENDVQKNPKSDEGWYLMGYSYGELGDIDGMIMGYDKSLAISSKYGKEINDSKSFHWANAFNKGVTLFQLANKTVDKDSAKIFYDKSIGAFESAVIIQPDSTDSYKNMAFVYMSSGRNEKAIKPLQQLVDRKKELDGYRYLGEIYFGSGSDKYSKFNMNNDVQDSIDAAEYFDKAITILQEGSSIYPGDGDLVRVLNASYIGAGRTEEALESSRILSETEPENETYKYNYGVILLQMNEFAAAEEQFIKALEIKPDYEKATYNLGLTYVNWGTEIRKQEEETEINTDEDIAKYNQALPYLEAIVKSDSENGVIWELLGKVYTILNMQDKAEDAFNKSDQYR